MTEKIISGIVGNSRNAQTSGTKVRKEMRENLDLIPRVITLIVLAILFVLLLTSSLSLFWRLVSAAVLFGIGSKITSIKDVKKESLWHFPIILKAMGVLIFAISTGTSGIAKKTDQLITYADACLQSKCPEQEEAKTSVAGVLSNIPKIEGNRVALNAGDVRTVWIKNPVSVNVATCHYLEIQPAGVFQIDDHVRYVIISPPVIGEYEEITVSSIRDTTAGRPNGC
jgi:hypothetical protein